MKDYYEILNINRDATEEEIEAAYQKLVEEYKPDEHTNDRSRIKYFEQIEEAYLTLSNGNKKYVYDQELMDHQSADLVWTLRQLDEKEKRKPFRVRPSSKLWTVLASFIIIGAVLFVFTLLDESSEVTFKSKRNGFDEISFQENNTAASENENASALENEENNNSTPATKDNKRQQAAAPIERNNGTNSATDTRRTTNDNGNSVTLNFDSLEDYLKAIGSRNRSYDEKASIIDEALKLFDDRKANVLVIGSNQVQTRRETIQNYLDIVMIQSYKVTVIDMKRNSNGKITQISVKEKL